MQTASGRAIQDKGSKGRRTVRKRPHTATLILAGLVTLLVLGLMVGVVLGTIMGFWPPKGPGPSGGITPDIQANATQEARVKAISDSGLKVEKAGTPRKEGDQVIVPVKVTNNLKVSFAPAGTPVADAPTPLPSPAHLVNGTVRVLFYGLDNTVNPPVRHIVGGAYGNVVDLQYGQSKTIEVIGTGLGDWTGNDYEVMPDAILTDQGADKSSTTPQPTP